MAENHNSRELVRELERTRNETLEYFTLGDSDLNRTYGPTGVRTLKDEFDKVVWHNENHLQQIRTALK